MCQTWCPRTRSRILRRPHTIDPAVSYIHSHRSTVLLNESHHLTHNSASRGRDEAEASAAKRLERDRIVHVWPVGRDDDQLPVEQHHLLVPKAPAVKPREALPRRVPGHGHW